jgi:hypothetical protein
MFTAIFLFLVLLVGAGCVVAGAVMKSWPWAGGGVAGVLIGGILWLAVMATPVGAYDVGVVTSYGKLEKPLGPGMHWVMPWKSVTLWDSSVWTVTYGRDQNQGHPDHCLLVKIGGQQTACLALQLTYQVRKGSAEKMWQKYRGSQNRMHELLVVKTLDQNLNIRLEKWSPITDLSHHIQPTLTPFAVQVTKDMKHQIGGDIAVESLQIQYPIYDRQTQNRLDGFATQKADTAIAEEAKKTAVAQAAAFRTLEARLGSGTNAVVAQCVNNVLIPALKQGRNLAGYPSCWPGAGSGSTVVVPAGR